jgi:LPS-assembly lipoprotein
MATTRVWLAMALCGASALMTGCGFHLRGTQAGVSGLAGLAVFIDSPAPYSDFEQVLEESVEQSDMTLVEQVDGAAMVIQLRNEQLKRRVQTVNTTGRASDYELILTIEYALAAPGELAEAETRKLETRREYNFDNAELLGKAEEEALLMQEMRRDIAARMLRQVGYLSAQSTATPTAKPSTPTPTP